MSFYIFNLLNIMDCQAIIRGYFIYFRACAEPLEIVEYNFILIKRGLNGGKF